MTPETAKLIEQHKNALTDFERAQIEAQLWDAATQEDRAKIGHRKYIRKLLPAVLHRAELRAALFNAGAEAAPLWDRVDGPELMPLPTAVMRLEHARIIAKRDGIGIPEAINIALTEYDTWPWVKTKSGGKFRKRPRGRIAREPNKHRRARRSTNPSEEGSREFWMHIREEIIKFTEARLNGLDTLLANKLQRDFCVDLQALVDEYSNKIDRARRSAQNDVTDEIVKLARLRSACEILAIDPPSRGGLIDLEKAKKNKKTLLRQFHPDAIGNDSKREQYQAVLDAYSTLESYTEINNVQAVAQ